MQAHSQQLPLQQGFLHTVEHLHFLLDVVHGLHQVAQALVHGHQVFVDIGQEALDTPQAVRYAVDRSTFVIPHVAASGGAWRSSGPLLGAGAAVAGAAGVGAAVFVPISACSHGGNSAFGTRASRISERIQPALATEDEELEEAKNDDEDWML